MQFGESIYLWRSYKGLTQSELAKKAGIPRPNLVAIEKGRRDVSLATQRRLAYALGTTPGDLVNGVSPIHLSRTVFSRESLEKIAKGEGIIGRMFTSVTKNRIYAMKKINKNSLRGYKDCINNWLLLKSSLGREIISNLISRQDKEMAHE